MYRRKTEIFIVVVVRNKSSFFTLPENDRTQRRYGVIMFLLSRLRIFHPTSTHDNIYYVIKIVIRRHVVAVYMYNVHIYIYTHDPHADTIRPRLFTFKILYNTAAHTNVLLTRQSRRFFFYKRKKIISVGKFRTDVLFGCDVVVRLQVIRTSLRFAVLYASGPGQNTYYYYANIITWHHCRYCYGTVPKPKRCFVSPFSLDRQTRR